MSRGLNKVMLIGNVGADPEARELTSGQTVASFSLATNRSWKGRDGQTQEKVEWHRLKFWGKLSDIVTQYVKKGDRLYVEGRIEYGSYEKDDGSTVYTTDIIVQEMVMLGKTAGGGDAAPASRSAPAKSAPARPITEPDDDLPF